MVSPSGTSLISCKTIFEFEELGDISRIDNPTLDRRIHFHTQEFFDRSPVSNALD